MRENMGLYRGKRKDNGEWVNGNLFENDNSYFPMVLIGHVIMSRDKHFPQDLNFDGYDLVEVDPETVGQFTGLTDKNRKKIFEGDVVRQTFAKSVPLYASSWGSDEYEDICGDDVGVVVIIPSKGACIKNPIIHREVDGEVTQHGEKAKMYKPVCCSRCEVIGNIHDNPELLE